MENYFLGIIDFKRFHAFKKSKWKLEYIFSPEVADVKCPRLFKRKKYGKTIETLSSIGVANKLTSETFNKYLISGKN